MAEQYTYDDLPEIIGYVNEIDLTKPDKLSYYGMQFASKLSKIARRFNKKVENMNIDHASTDDRNDIISTKEKPFSFKPEKLKELNHKLEELGKEKIEIRPYICPHTERVMTLPFHIIYGLNGLLWDIDLENVTGAGRPAPVVGEDAGVSEEELGRKNVEA